MINISRKSRLFYDGIPLIKYCKDNNINFSTINSRICRKRKDLKYSEYNEQEIVDIVINSYNKKIKYFYNGIPLIKYCEDNNIDYNKIRSRINYLKKDYPKLDNDELVAIAIGKINKNRKYKEKEYQGEKYKYFYNNIPLKIYCEKNDIDYDIIKHRINYLQKTNPDLNDQEIDVIISETIEKIKIKNDIKYINEIFCFLRKEEIYDSKKLIEICNYLKIDYDNVIMLKNMNLSYNQAVNIIWYFFDNKNLSDYKQITKEKIFSIFSLIDNIKDKAIDLKSLDLYDLISIYKCNLYDTRNEIVLVEKCYILGTMKSLCLNYNIQISQSNFEDFYSQITLNLLEALEKSNLNNSAQIIKYMDLYVKGYFRLYLKKYIKEKNILSLDERINSDDKSKTRIEYISDTSNLYETTENTSFSSDMMKLLSLLSPEDLSFIMLKYQENYSDEDLSNYFDLTLNEIKQKEILILSSLKNNGCTKVLSKKIN